MFCVFCLHMIEKRTAPAITSAAFISTNSKEQLKQKEKYNEIRQSDCCECRLIIIKVN